MKEISVVIWVKERRTQSSAGGLGREKRFTMEFFKSHVLGYGTNASGSRSRSRNADRMIIQ